MFNNFARQSTNKAFNSFAPIYFPTRKFGAAAHSPAGIVDSILKATINRPQVGGTKLFFNTTPHKLNENTVTVKSFKTVAIPATLIVFPQFLYISIKYGGLTADSWGFGVEH